MAITLLCAADFHLGRRLRGVPESVESSACTPVAAWERLIERALATRPDAVLLAGDVVDQDNRFFEAFGVLEAGIKKLVAENIPVLGVAGNHDHDVFPRLADRIGDFRLIGRGGRWEKEVVSREGKPLFEVHGLSFNQKHIRDNPLQIYRLEREGDLPVVGLLHCDLGAAKSPYAPVSTADFSATNAVAWVLGHIHIPGMRAENPLVFYCGSPQGLDPSETGMHGAWEVRVDDAGNVERRLIPLAGLRWETQDVPLEGVADREGFQVAVADAVAGLHEKISGEFDPETAVGCRLRLTGRTAVHERIAFLSEEVVEGSPRTQGGVEYFVDKIIDEAGPDLPLEDLAGGGDLAALLAGRILLLENRAPEDRFQKLIGKGRERLERVTKKNTYGVLDEAGSLADEEVRDVLLRAGRRALEGLLATKGASP